MALPFSFSNVSTLVTSQLDANYNALGALTPVPCVVSGTNALSLTPEINTPTVSSYSNYMQFTGIATATNTTTTTAAVGSNAALTVYKDTNGGPVALSGGEIVIGNQIVLLYDSALNTGAGGFHLIQAGGGQVTTTGGTISGLLTLLGSVKIGSTSNASLSNVVSTSSSIGWANIPAATASVSTIPLTGASVGDCVLLGTPASVPTGIVFFGWVSTVGTVSIQALNATGSSLTPVAGTYRVTANRYTP